MCRITEQKNLHLVTLKSTLLHVHDRPCRESLNSSRSLSSLDEGKTALEPSACSLTDVVLRDYMASIPTALVLPFSALWKKVAITWVAPNNYRAVEQKRFLAVVGVLATYFKWKMTPHFCVGTPLASTLEYMVKKGQQTPVTAHWFSRIVQF